jgi:cytochrome oxidase Cu insertion factor (SCO1/SenC/PrrC family)
MSNPSSPARRRPGAALATFSILVLAMLAVAGTIRQSLPALAATGQREPLAVGQVAPLFTLSNLEGQTVQLADYIGKKVVILSFWATW